MWKLKLKPKLKILKYNKKFYIILSWGFQFIIIENKSLLVFIHDSSMNPYPAEDYNNLNGDSIYVPTGFSNDINIEKVIRKVN